MPKSIEKVHFKDVKFSSEQSVNSVIDSTADALNPDTFSELSFEWIKEQRPLNSWVLSKIALNATNIIILNISDLCYTTPENQVALMNLAESIFSAS